MYSFVNVSEMNFFCKNDYIKNWEIGSLYDSLFKYYNYLVYWCIYKLIFKDWGKLLILEYGGWLVVDYNNFCYYVEFCCL